MRRFKIINVVTGERVDPTQLALDLKARGELIRFSDLFNGKLPDLKIMLVEDENFVEDKRPRKFD